jgi:hypothetical protein
MMRQFTILIMYVAAMAGAFALAVLVKYAVLCGLLGLCR